MLFLLIKEQIQLYLQVTQQLQQMCFRDEFKSDTQKVTNNCHNVAPSGRSHTPKSIVKSSKIKVLMQQWSHNGTKKDPTTNNN